ncbi:hypothetical protein HOE91_06085 [archaeon]|nr:hypothetical protein [archaeon]
MTKELKITSMVLVLLLGLVTLATFVSAASDNYEIDAAYLDGVELDPNGQTAISAELGDEITVKAELTGVGEYIDDVKVKAWIGGYEYGDMEDTTGSFDVEGNVTYLKTLNLELPEDLDVCMDEENNLEEGDDCSFTLYVEVYDDDDYEREAYVLFIERPRHYITVMDVIVDSEVNADELAKVEVRLENLGESKEEDIKVTVSVDELGITESGYVDELAAPELDNEDEESSDSIFLYLEVPQNAEGYYDIEVDVSYNRGHDSVEEVTTLYVKSVEPETETETETETEEVGEVSVSVDLENTDVLVGEEAVYEVKFSNPGEASQIFTIDVLGEDQWGNSEIEPSIVMVKGGESETVNVYVTPNEAGEYSFTLQILDGDEQLLHEETVELTVEESASDSGIADWLKILFIVIVVIIIIIILVVAFRKMGDDEDEDYDLDKEGQTYY